MGKSKSKSGGARNYTPLLTARPKGMSYQEYRERRSLSERMVERATERLYLLCIV